MGLVRSFIGTDGIWQYIPHINTGLFSIIKVHFLLFANLIVDWHINTINFTDSGLRNMEKREIVLRRAAFLGEGRFFLIICRIAAGTVKRRRRLIQEPIAEYWQI